MATEVFAVPVPAPKLEEVGPETVLPAPNVVVEAYPVGIVGETTIVTAPAGIVRPRLSAATENREKRLDFDIGKD